jgi:predicted Fe-Mo cluster-binding NifX family protein
MRPLTLAYEVKGSLVVYVGTPLDPDEREWDDYLDALRRVGQEQRLVRIIIFVGKDGPAPNALLRKRSAALSKQFAHDLAVIADSTVARAAVTALRWVGVKISAFPPSRVDDALTHLKATAEERSWALEAERRLHARLSAPK